MGLSGQARYVTPELEEVAASRSTPEDLPSLESDREIDKEPSSEGLFVSSSSDSPNLLPPSASPPVSPLSWFQKSKLEPFAGTLPLHLETQPLLVENWCLQCLKGLRLTLAQSMALSIAGKAMKRKREVDLSESAGLATEPFPDDSAVGQRCYYGPHGISCDGCKHRHEKCVVVPPVLRRSANVLIFLLRRATYAEAAEEDIPYRLHALRSYATAWAAKATEWETSEKETLKQLGPIGIIQRDMSLAIEAQNNFTRWTMNFGGIGRMARANIVVDEEVEAGWMERLDEGTRVKVWGA